MHKIKKVCIRLPFLNEITVFLDDLSQKNLKGWQRGDVEEQSVSCARSFITIRNAA